MRPVTRQIHVHLAGRLMPRSLRQFPQGFQGILGRARSVLLFPLRRETTGNSARKSGIQKAVPVSL